MKGQDLSNTFAFCITSVDVMARVVSVTRKGQATIPKDLREKFGVGNRVLVVETDEGILFKPLPRPEDDFGSLKELFSGKTAREILEEARTQDRMREKKMLEGAKR
jgi:AbrB family looped-hinge helix DNA binding protein